MARNAAQMLVRLRKIIPEAFRHPHESGVAAVAALIEAFGETAADQARPATATGVYLREHARGLGLVVQSSEPDDQVLQRIRTRDRRVTRPVFEAALDAFFEPISVTYQLVEAGDARIYCDDDATEYVTDAFCDEDHLLMQARHVAVVVDEGELTADEEQSLLNLLRHLRAAGITAWVVFEDGLSIIQGTPWEEP